MLYLVRNPYRGASADNLAVARRYVFDYLHAAAMVTGIRHGHNQFTHPAVKYAQAMTARWADSARRAALVIMAPSTNKPSVREIRSEGMRQSRESFFDVG